jgi:hypothetical protein
MQAAHTNAVLYAERMKKNRSTSIEGQKQVRDAAVAAQKSNEEATSALAVAEAEKSPTKIVEAVSKKTKAQRDQEIADQVAQQQGAIIANAWMTDHLHDFVNCQANTNIIGAWLEANKLEFTYDNLESAYNANENRLAKPTSAPVEVPAPVVHNTPTVAPAAPAATQAPIAPVAPVAPVPVSAPAPVAPPAAAVAPAPTPVAAPNTPAARRPGVNGGIQPGTLSAQRPQQEATSATLSKSELLKVIAKMPREEYRKKLTHSKEFRAQLRAAGIPVAGQE